jgi:Trk K+ transport system NAD-binding subunit
MFSSLPTGPWRNLIAGLIYMVAITALATSAYMLAGWSLSDAFYFVVITIFTVGYQELHPIVSPEMRALTMATIVLGCTGVIFLTGALVQAFTYTQIQQLLGNKRMKTQIEKMTGHVIICGFGRIGHALAEELRAGGIEFVIVDLDEARLARASAEGFHTWAGDATTETTLNEVGVLRARALATVVPNDAVNVFITLTARSLNKDIEIIARGVSPSTKGKLLHAGASSVVEPTHIGAERIAQLILYPRTSRITEGTQRIRAMAAGLHGLGLDLEVAAVPPDSPMAGVTIEQAEHDASGTMFIIAINRKNGETLTRPDPSTMIEPGDGVVMITRSGRTTTKAS